MSDLSMVFAPRSVAVIGASRNPAKRGYQAVLRLVEDEFPGAIYPINPDADEIAGVRAYRSLAEVDDQVDLALIVRPADRVPEALEQCGRAGVKGAIIIAVGFRESGEVGRQLEEEVMRTAREYSIRLVGPNTSGVFNTHARLNVVGVQGVPRGGVSVLSQSGNVILGLLNQAKLSSPLGFASYVGLGNETDIKFHECLAELRRDSHTEAIIVYAEGFRDGRAFLQELYRTVTEKPVVVHKAGRSDAGTKSAASHTGALAGSFEVADGALRQAGAVSVRRSDELFPVAEALAMAVPMTGTRVAVIADGGGHATMAADSLVEQGLLVAPLTRETQAELRGLLGRAAAVANPVDVAGAADSDPTVFAAVMEAVLADPNVDGALMVGLFGGYASRFSEGLAPAEMKAADSLVRAVDDHRKPLVVQSVYAGFEPEALAVLARGGIPVHQSIDIGARCVAALSQRGTFLAGHEGRSDLSDRVPDAPSRLSAFRGMLPEHEARAVLEAYGIPVAPWHLAESASEAEVAAKRFGGTVALKVVSSDVIHKSDVGGVLLGVGPEEAAESFRAIHDTVAAALPAARVEGILVSPMAGRGLELIVGMTHDPTFGPVLMLGLGGVMVDAIGGTAFRVLPINRQEALELTHEFGSAAALEGFRGFVPDREALVDLLVAASELVMAEPGIREFDFNPVVLGPEGALVVDARVVMDAVGTAGP
jgi:acetyltransferase